MNYLFIATGGTKVENTIFKQYYPAINKSMSWDTILPFVKQATRTYLVKHLGQVTYDLIAGNGTGAELEEVRDILRFALANYTIYEALPSLNATISDMGVVEKTNENTIPISQWRLKTARWEALVKGDTFLDQAIDYIISKPGVFTAFTFTGSVFFKTTTSFQQYSTIAGPRAFQAMLPYIREAEDALEEKLCTFYPEVKAKLADTSELWMKLVHLCKRYIAHEAMMRAIPRLLLYIDGDGIKLTSSGDTFDQKSNILASFGKDGPDNLVRALRLDSKAAFQAVENWLYKNKTEADFATWVDNLPEYDDSPAITASGDGVGGIGIF